MYDPHGARAPSISPLADYRQTAAQPPAGAALAREAEASGLLQRIRPLPGGGFEIDLHAPISAHTETGELRTLRLRAPTLEVFAALGEPVQLRQGANVESAGLLDFQPTAAFMPWLERLSGHDRGVLGKMCMMDARLCLVAVFFSSLAASAQ